MKLKDLLILFFLFFHDVSANEEKNNSPSFFQLIMNKIMMALEETDHDQVFTINLPPIPPLKKKGSDISLSPLNDVNLKFPFDALHQDEKRKINFYFLNELFLVTRGMKPKDKDLSNWMNVLDQGGSREGIYRSLVLDDIYLELETSEEVPSEALVQKINSFLIKFVKISIPLVELQSMNRYRLKRLLTEYFLDMMDSFQDREHFSLWYAILSSDIAKMGGAYFSEPKRKIQDEKFHFDWAQNSSIDHIKSEIILKTHLVMNKL